MHSFLCKSMQTAVNLEVLMVKREPCLTPSFLLWNVDIVIVKVALSQGPTQKGMQKFLYVLCE